LRQSILVKVRSIVLPSAMSSPLGK
jgi:hypothetical protein